jgi:hypothetical protein
MADDKFNMIIDEDFQKLLDGLKGPVHGKTNASVIRSAVARTGALTAALGKGEKLMIKAKNGKLREIVII